LEWVGDRLGTWKAAELKLARRFRECRGLGDKQVEDVYAATVEALLERPYTDEGHLREALRVGIKYRALREKRDGHRHARILLRNVADFRAALIARERSNEPERAALARQDRLIAVEFLTELTEPELDVFAWLAEGLKYRAIATKLGMPEAEAQNLSRSVERKRERFQVLYDAGRLCGYRRRTIQALQDGEGTSVELAARAFAHLDACVRCQLEYGTNAARLRRRFHDQAAALLPPVLLGHLSWLARLGVRARLFAHRLGVDTAPIGQGSTREATITVLTGGGAIAKVAATAVTVGVLAGGAVVTNVVEHPTSPNQQHRPPAARTMATGSTLDGRASASTTVAASARGRHVQSGSRRGSRDPAQMEPGGFAYLGVPTASTTKAHASSAKTVSAHVARSSPEQRGGGLFSP
jgi:DNA-binding CsgD family transcriptional regulator